MATLVVVLVITALVTVLTPKTYRSSIEFFVSVSVTANASQLASGNNFTQQRVKSYAELVRTPRALNPVLQATGGGTSADLADQVTASIPPDSVLLDISVTDHDPQRARQVATAIGETFPGVVADLEEVDGTNPVKVTIVKEATEPEMADPQPLRNLVFGLIIGAMLGLAACAARDRLDHRVRSREDLESLTPTTLLGTIPVLPAGQRGPLVSESGWGTDRGEAFRALRTNVTFIEATAGVKTLVVTSATVGEGSSTVTANLGVALGQSGARVCLVEADLRHPGLGSAFGLDDGRGLSDVLAGRASLDSVVHHFGEDGLDVLAAGPVSANPSELLGSPAMATVLTELAARYDFVLIDAPPVLPVTDATVLSVHADGVVLVVGADLVEEADVQEALARLAAVGGNVVGLVLNRARTGQPVSY